MNFLHTTLAKVADTVAAGSSPDYGIFDNQDPFTGKQGAYRVQLHPHAKVSHRLTRLYEGSSYIMVADHAHLEGDAALLCVAQCGIGA